MIRRLTTIGVLAAATLAMSVSTATAATVPLAQWTPKFCNAVTTYESTISTKGEALETALDGATDLATARTQTAAFYGDMATAARTAKQDIKAAGTPATTNGARIVTTFVSGLEASAKLFAKAQAQAAKLPTGSAEAFKVKGKELSQNLSAAGDELSKQFGGVRKLDKGKKLQAAVKSTPECESLT